MPKEAVTKHLSSLSQQQKKLNLEQYSPYPELAYRAVKNGGSVEVRVLYGDITKRSYMDDQEFQGLRRAIVSPEDTFLSAGGGVAFRLVEKAGSIFMLNELAKFAPINHGTVAVTSGGNLPLHYVFHAASIEIQDDGSYAVSQEKIRLTMTEVLKKAAALGVGALWVPLLGAGVASLKPRQSLDGILRAVAAWQGRLIILMFIYREKELDRGQVLKSLKAKLGAGYKIAAF